MKNYINSTFRKLYWKCLLFYFSFSFRFRNSVIKNNIIWFYFDNPNNIGDKSCSPSNYLNEFDSKRKNLKLNLVSKIYNFEAKTIIFGGGGLFQKTELTERIGLIAKIAKKRDKKTKLIIWGIGANTHGQKNFEYPDYLSHFDLVGIRDYGNPWNYVPCSSCLHPIFNQKRKAPKQDIVVYEHFQSPIKDFPEFPKMNNFGKNNHFLSVINFLSTASVVISNTYHGIYWSLLLGKKVLIYRPFSNRFLGFSRPMVIIEDKKDLKVKIKSAKQHDDFLSESKQLNLNFLKRVNHITGNNLKLSSKVHNFENAIQQ